MSNSEERIKAVLSDAFRITFATDDNTNRVILLQFGKVRKGTEQEDGLVQIDAQISVAIRPDDYIDLVSTVVTFVEAYKQKFGIDLLGLSKKDGDENDGEAIGNTNEKCDNQSG